jgi:hypothetical protein
MLGSLWVASQVLYVANTSTFGCTSIEEMSRLRHLRATKPAFQKELVEQIFEGQCVEITKGKLVEGAIEPGDASALRVDREIQPPGYVAPLNDFQKLKRPNGSR